MDSMCNAYAGVSVAIAGYFATSFGLDAGRVFGSSLRGGAQLGRPIVGRLIGLEPGGLTGFALCLAALELATTAVLVIYLLERLAGDDRVKSARQTLEAALMLVATQSVALLAAGLVHLDGGSIRRSVIQLALIGIAVLLAAMESHEARDEVARGGPGASELSKPSRPDWHDPAGTGWFSVWRPGMVRPASRTIPEPGAGAGASLE
ncbi:MAG TPA: hypothetical protein VK281_11750 [Xanthobacteraceae bacterium]|nr:hypothetical protein [Xanthobacteraceae bacterium]